MRLSTKHLQLVRLHTSSQLGENFWKKKAYLQQYLGPCMILVLYGTFSYFFVLFVTLVDCSLKVKIHLAKLQNAFSVCICLEYRKDNTLHCCSSNKKSCNNQKMYCEDRIEPIQARRCRQGVDAENDAIVMMQNGG